MKSIFLFFFAAITTIASAQEDSVLNGYWSFKDSVSFETTYDDFPGTDQRSRINDRADSIEIDNRTLYILEASKRYLLGYIKWRDSSSFEYMRRCCWDPKPIFRVDSLSNNYLRIFKVTITEDEGYDPDLAVDEPLPRGPKQPASTIKEVQVVVFKRWVDED